MTPTHKLAKFFENEFNSHLKDVLVIRDHSGTLGLYGKYVIKQLDDGYVKAIVLNSDEQPEFTTLQNAVAWCTLHHANLFRDSTRLKELDLKLSSLMMELEVHRKLYKIAEDQETKLLFTTKVQDDTYKRKQVIREIGSFINSSRIIQARKFRRMKDHNFR
jgi:hypothetical protein